MFKKVLLFACSWLTLYSCKKADINFGSEFVNTNATQVIKLDTFSVDVSTVLLDSFTTSGKGVALLGGYTDPAFGRVDCKTFLELAPAEYSTATFPTNCTFDSLNLILTLNRTYYGDSTKPINLYVRQLAEKIIPYDNGYYLYNTQKFSEAALLGQKSSTYLLPTRLPADTISIRLSDALGQLFLKKMMNESDKDLKSASDFLEYFKGISISSDNNSNIVFGCKDSVKMRLYYKSPGISSADRSFDFSLSNASHQFNNIAVNRSGTPLAQLGTKRQLHSSLTTNLAYSQPATGAMIKLRFPNIREILALPQFTQIIKAQLVVRPLKNSYNNFYPLPPTLRLSYTTVFNQIGINLKSYNAFGSAVDQTGDLSIDYLYGDNTTYTYDLSNHIKSLVQDGSDNQNGLLLIPPSPNLENTFNRVIIGNKQHTTSKIELQIYYVAVK